MMIREERYQELRDMFWKENDELGTGMRAQGWRNDLTKEEAAMVADWDRGEEPPARDKSKR